MRDDISPTRMTIKKQIQQDEASSVELRVLFFTVKRFFPPVTVGFIDPK